MMGISLGIGIGTRVAAGDPGDPPAYAPSLNFSDARNSMYL